MTTLRDPATGKFLPVGPNPTVIMPDGSIGIVIVHDGETYTAIVDAEDYPKVKDYRWCLISNEPSHPRNTTYARSTVYNDGGGSKTIRLHQLLLGGPGTIIDHRDSSGLNCRRANLRVADPTGNSRNRRVNRTSASGIKGVHLLATGKWRASIRAGGKSIHLGHFATADLARDAYDRACIELHGEFARPNPVAGRFN